MIDPYYPPGAFYFTVTTLATAGLGGIDSSFQEVSGLQAELETETVVEGGENRFAYKLPRYVRYPNLVLKRGAVAIGSLLTVWLTATMNSGLALPIVPQNLMVTLLNRDGWPLITWTVVGAYPVRWELGTLSSEDNKVLLETLELSYNYFFRMPV